MTKNYLFTRKINNTMINVITFKLKAVPNSFSINNRNLEELLPINWNSKDPTSLSVTFNNQIKRNFYTLLTLKISCESEEPNISSYMEGRYEIYPINPKDKERVTF
jgi:hypothetical protein